MSQINLSLFPLRYMSPLSKLILLRKRPKGKWKKNHLNRRRNAAIPMLSLESPAMCTRSKKMDPASPAMSTRSNRRLSLWSTCMYVSLDLWLSCQCEIARLCKLQLCVNLLVEFMTLFMDLSSCYTKNLIILLSMWCYILWIFSFKNDELHHYTKMQKIYTKSKYVA